MLFLNKINIIKRRFFTALTKPFKNSNNLELLKDIPKDARLKVLITRPNHRLGNQLLITPLIQEIELEFPNCKIDLIVNGTLSEQLFTNFECIDHIIPLPKKPFKHLLSYISKCMQLLSKKYDIAVVGCEDSSSGKIFAKLSRAKFKIINSDNTNNINKPLHIAKYPIYNFKKALNKNDDLIDYDYARLSIKLSKEEKEKGAEIMNSFFNNKKTVISIFTFATGSKCYSKDWWGEFYNMLKTKFPESNILEILPMENVSQIDFKSEHFYGRDLREIAAIMENSDVFIGADSGMMHLAAATNTSTIGLFDITDTNIYEPYGRKNRSINTTKTDKNKIIEIISNLSFYN